MISAQTKSEQKRLDQIAKHFTAQTGFEKTLTQYKIREILKFSKGNRILDIGCGEGIITRALAAKHKEVVGIDGSFQKIKIARKMSQKRNTMYTVSLFEVFNTEKKFDCIVASNILEHVKSPSRFLKKAFVLLHRKGRIIVTAPNARGLHKRIGKILGMIKSFYELTPADRRKGHRRIYDRNRLVCEVQNAGFRIGHSGGIFLKPLSHRQMESWDKRICDALYEMGRELPDYCSSIIVVADK